MGLVDAKKWVWQRLERRAGMATKGELYAAWDHAPALLDDALRSLRDDGLLSCSNGYWFIRDGIGRVA